MKKTSFAILFVATILLSAFAIINTVNWQIKDGYSLKFEGSHVDGKFEKVSGDIAFDEANLSASHFLVKVDVASIATGNWLKNIHAKNESWFNADKYPGINFTSAKISKTAQGYSVEGTLDMHGTKKLVTIPFTFLNNTFRGSFSVNRLDYGIGTMEGMSKKVSNEIKIDISVPVVAKK